MAKAKNDAFVFLPLGGVGEIGMNLALYGFGVETERKWIVVDMGVCFAGPEHPGADLIMPDIRFLEKERENIEAIIITHAHEDHFGAVLDLWQRVKLPIYCTEFTAHLLDAKRVGDCYDFKLPVKVFKAGETIKLGPFTIEALQVNHSIPNAISLAIETKLGKVIHTGDWKIDNFPALNDCTDEKRFQELGDEGILALICDSTNATKEGVSPSEKDVKESLEQIIREEKGRVAITTFSSNIGRIRSIALAAQEAGRKILLVGRSIKRSVAIAEELGYLDGVEPFLNEEDYTTLERDKIVLILTGSQGEQRAALAKIAKGEMRGLKLSVGDTVIYSSRNIPGNERAIIDTQNRLIDLGMKVITDQQSLVHASGHPRRNELLKMYQMLRPKILVPVHGEALHLAAHAQFGKDSGIETVFCVRNGDLVTLAPNAHVCSEDVPVGRCYKDGKLIGSEEEMGIRQRRKLSYVGHVVVLMELSGNFNTIEDIEIMSLGLPEKDNEGEYIEDILLDAIEAAFQTLLKAKRKDLALVKEVSRRAVRAQMLEIWGKKPFITVFVR